MDRWANRQIDTPMYSKTDRQADRQTDMFKNKKVDRRANRPQPYRKIDISKNRRTDGLKIQTDRWLNKTNRQRD